MARITVVGAGVIGLSTAIRLREAGHDATIVAERRTPQTTSDRSGAVFTPFRAQGCPDALAWARGSFEAYSALAQRGDPACGVRMTRLREFFFTPLDADPWWAESVAQYERLRDVPPPYAAGVRAVVPKIDITRYMGWLERDYLERCDGTICTARVASLATLFDDGAELVVNCSGLGARALAEDPHVIPMRGQVLHVANTIGLEECLVEEGRGSLTTYLFAFPDHVVLGGTYERNNADESTDPAALAAIVERCRGLLTAAGYDSAARLPAEPLRSWAGLRPARIVTGDAETIRLEAESRGGRTVIHNYGHGRAGVTFAWGCADAVCALVAAQGIE